MTGTVLELGPVTFSAFEIPTGINFGGRQILAVHQLTDGRRVIDSIGPAESEISFSGAFSGPTATLRARQLNDLRVSGAELSLTWDAFCYTVVVSTFDADYRNSGWIPYRLSCAILRDEASPVLTPALSLETSTLSDLTAAGSVCGDMGVDFTAALAALAENNATTLGSAAYGAAQLAISNTQSDIAAQISTAETTIGASGMQIETSPVSLVNDLIAVTGAAQQLAGMIYANSYVGRAARNLQNASS